MCEEVIKEVNSVFKYILPDTCSDAEKEANPITAEEVVEAIKDGKDVEIINAVIEGPFILKSVNVEGEITIKNTKIRDYIDWSYATFKKVLRIENSTFETDATFAGATVEKDLTLDETTFQEKTIFSDIAVMGVFSSQSTTFKKDVTFEDGTFKKKIVFSKSTFEAENDFSGVRIGSYANFIEAVFKKLADFHGARIEDDVFFMPATFEGEANFVDTQIGGNANFAETQFEGEANFVDTQIGGNANFAETQFEGEANFSIARIGSHADFTKTKFVGHADFNAIQIEGAAFFRQAHFNGKANFIGARIGINAEFAEAEFEKLADFHSAKIEKSAYFNSVTFVGEANFVSVRIDNIAVFTGAEFKEQASFSSAQIERESHFEGAIFGNDVSFQDTSLNTVIFEKPYLFSWDNVPGNDNKRLLRFLKDDLNVGWVENAEIIKSDDGETIRISKDENSAEIVIDEGKEKATLRISDSRTHDLKVKKEDGKLNIYEKLKVQFHATIDLRGCIYDRIHPISFWQQLMEHLGPYDRQPFTQLEETFRRAGKDKLADDVYYERKCRESAQKTIRKPSAWLLDRFLFRFTGYGVRLYRLLWAIVPILIIGTLIFHLEGAVTPELHSAIPWSEAFWVSLNTFLPVIEIPSGADWKPSSQIIPIIPVLNIKFTTFATLLVLAGWILVPVAVAGITGLLKRPK